MKLDEFVIGHDFYCGGFRYKCTDIGTRTIAAIRIGEREIKDPSWLNGPPYAVYEIVMDEEDQIACTKEASAA